jgi:1,2-diacylglycerol 3-beta-galactosyltransferase
MKRILILTADLGYGHRSAANAIANALHETYGPECRVSVVNPMDDPRAPAYLRDGATVYDRLVRETPELYRLAAQMGEGRVAGTVRTGSLAMALLNVMREVIREQLPDAIVCTFPTYQGIVEAVYGLEKRRIPLITVVTDLGSVDQVWFHPAVDLCLVPTQKVYDLAIEAGLRPENVKLTGLPVRPELAKGGPDPAALRHALGWQPDTFTVLAIGGKRVDNLYDSLRVLNHSGLPLQLVVAAGADKELFQRLQETEWHVTAHIHDFVSDMGTFLRAADCVLSKAGGLIVSEALACGLPLILIDVIAGQETGNANHVVAGDAGVLAEDPVAVLETVCHWLEHDQRGYLRQAENARRLGHPQAAFEVAKLVWEAASS